MIVYLQARPSNHNHIVPIACCQNFGRPHFRAETSFKVHVMTYLNMESDNISVGIYLDLQKAFDTVSHKILLTKK